MSREFALLGLHRWIIVKDKAKPTNSRAIAKCPAPAHTPHCGFQYKGSQTHDNSILITLRGSAWISTGAQIRSPKTCQAALLEKEKKNPLKMSQFFRN